jgi:hypothetical protein
VTATRYVLGAEEAAAAEAFERVFARDNPFEGTFAERVAHRAIVYPLKPPFAPLPDWIEQSLRAVAALAEAAGDDGFYRTYYDWWEQGKPRSSYVPLAAVPERYADLDQRLDEFALVSPSGRWGAMTAGESWALVGADRPELLERFLDAFPPVPDVPAVGFAVSFHGSEQHWRPEPGTPPREQVRVFLSLWDFLRRAGGSRVGWLPGLLAHVYGEARAAELLADWPELR